MGRRQRHESMLTGWHHIFSRRIDITVRIARRQAQVSKQALRSPDERKVLPWMVPVVPAHLDRKPASGVPHELPHSTTDARWVTGPTGSSNHPFYPVSRVRFHPLVEVRS